MMPQSLGPEGGRCESLKRRTPFVADRVTGFLFYRVSASTGLSHIAAGLLYGSRRRSRARCGPITRGDAKLGSYAMRFAVGLSKIVRGAAHAMMGFRDGVQLRKA
jgi:hypothetical protein